MGSGLASSSRTATRSGSVIRAGAEVDAEAKAACVMAILQLQSTGVCHGAARPTKRRRAGCMHGAAFATVGTTSASLQFNIARLLAKLCSTALSHFPRAFEQQFTLAHVARHCGGAFELGACFVFPAE